MAKKDFSQVANAGRVYETIANATAEPEQETQEIEETQETPQMKKREPRTTYTEEETREPVSTKKKTGRKSKDMSRINMAFYPDVYEYINIMSRVRGESMTDFVNHILRESRDLHADIYQKAIEFRKSL